MAAGRGSRMKGFDGNKTLLPLIPGRTPFEGSHPILIHILDNLPSGPKALIVNHKKADVVEATRNFNIAYYDQPVLNGTGGALLAAREFIESTTCRFINITMGDIPFVQTETYFHLIEKLKDYDLVVLGFQPEDKKQYGVLEIEGDRVQRIIEWKYWKNYPKEIQEELKICNSGIYAARKKVLLPYLAILESRPQIVEKEIDGTLVEFEEFFITDLIEYMSADNMAVGYTIAENPVEMMGVDDLSALAKAQSIFRSDHA
jgi:bifunctional UDP-N-acetylglucosamine pyrophosphorylase/glucosamine-1-phosphate N-acetyltransferase